MSPQNAIKLNVIFFNELMMYQRGDSLLLCTKDMKRRVFVSFDFIEKILFSALEEAEEDVTNYDSEFNRKEKTGAKKYVLSRYSLSFKDIEICPFGDDLLFLKKNDGKGMSVSPAEIENLLIKWYEENF